MGSILGLVFSVPYGLISLLIVLDKAIPDPTDKDPHKNYLQELWTAPTGLIIRAISRKMSDLTLVLIACPINTVCFYFIGANIQKIMQQ